MKWIQSGRSFWNNNYIWGSHEYKFTCIKASRYNNHLNNTQCKLWTTKTNETHLKRKDEENITEWWSNATAINRPRNEDMQSIDWLSKRFVCQQLSFKINSNDAKNLMKETNRKKKNKKKRTLNWIYKRKNFGKTAYGTHQYTAALIVRHHQLVVIHFVETNTTEEENTK